MRVTQPPHHVQQQSDTAEQAAAGETAAGREPVGLCVAAAAHRGVSQLFRHRRVPGAQIDPAFSLRFRIIIILTTKE